MSSRIVFITQEDPFYVRIFFEEFFAQYPQMQDIVAVCLAPPMGKRSALELARQMYDLYGPWDFLRMSARYAWYKLAARLPRGRSARQFFSVAQVCRAHKVEVQNVADVNSEAFRSWLAGRSPDLVVSVACPQIFRKPLIGIPRLGCINIHNSPLPRYRGMLPNFWQMFHGEKQAATTVHRVDESIDSGAILLQRATPIVPGESLDDLICKTKRHGASIMIEAIRMLLEGTVQEIPNVAAEGSYFHFPTRADAREFRRKGLRLL